MNRRALISFLGGAAAAWPLASRAQQPAMPVVGFLRSTPATGFAYIVDPFRQGLNDAKSLVCWVETASAAADLWSELIAAEREYIYQLLREGKLTDEARPRIERELDLEEASIARKKEGGGEPPL